MTDFFAGIAFFLIIEGLVYALAPRLLKSIVAQLPDISDESLRMFGLAAVAAGVFLIWLIRIYLA